MLKKCETDNKIKRIVIQVEVAKYAHKNHIGMYGMQAA